MFASPDHGGHQDSGSTSGAAILAAFIPTFTIACIYIIIFLIIRDWFRKFYSPRTFLGTISEKHRTPDAKATRFEWLRSFWSLPDKFILQHNSLDAYLYLRFLWFLIFTCLAGSLLIWPILLPIHATGGGQAKQLDRLSFANVDRNDYLWAHVVIAWVWFGAVFVAIAIERLKLVGIRQAYYLDREYSSRLSARTVLFLNVPDEALQPQNLHNTFGDQAEKSWPVKSVPDLDALVKKRTDTAMNLESAQVDYILRASKSRKHNHASAGISHGTGNEESQAHTSGSHRPSRRDPPLIGVRADKIASLRETLVDTVHDIETYRSNVSDTQSGRAAVFVAYSSQEAAHRAFQTISFQPRLPLEDRFLAVQPKEVLWENLAMPVPKRLSKASLALVFVIVFTIFFSIPVGIVGTLSNVKELADRVQFLAWLKDLPSPILGLLTGLVPPFLTSWFVSYVPKLFRHIAKLSGEPTTSQAELKTQAWYLVFQVVQVFLVTTFSSGAAAVATKIARNPASAPDLLASSLPKASNFYLTYFILQGTTSAASNVLNYSDLFELLFYEWFWDKTPRQKFTTHAQMKGTPWASWYPKFTNFFIIAIVYSCIAPLTLGFATIGMFIYYLSYRYSMFYVRQTKIDTKGEAYKRALQQMPTALYLAQLCLIGLFSARQAPTQAALIIVLLVLTAVGNLIFNRMLKPLELYLGVDKWQEQEVPLLADEDGVDPNDEAALHAASHTRRLGLQYLPKPVPHKVSHILDSVISSARSKATGWLNDPAALIHDEVTQLSGRDLDNVYLAPAFSSKTPKLWLPSDKLGISKTEIEANETAHIATTDQAAEVDENGKLHWDHHFENVPIYSAPKTI